MEGNEFKRVYEDNTIIVLDTNILLALVKYSTYSSSNIIKILNACIDKIWIPNQVYREYNKHKNQEFAKAKKKYENFKKEIESIVRETSQRFHKAIKESRKLEYPNCDNLEIQFQNQLNNFKVIINDYFKNLGIEYDYTKKEKQVRDLEAFINKITECNKVGRDITQKELLNTIQEGELRYKYKIPPGYEDLKEKDGIEVFGDLFIWKELLNYPKENNVPNIIFVTNDLKEDWWILKGEDKLPVKMRPELLKEFKETNSNCEIFFLNLATFQNLTAEYFHFPSFHTYLELNADTYCRNKLFPKYSKALWDEIYSYAFQLDVVDFSEEFYRCNDNEVLADDLVLISCEFQIDNDFAIYTMIVNLPVEIYLSYEDNEGDSFPMGEVNLTVEANIEISQKISTENNTLEEDDGYEITYIDYKNVQVTDPYDYYGNDNEENHESDASAEMYETLEDYHKH